jgi:cell division protein FtsB
MLKKTSILKWLLRMTLAVAIAIGIGYVPYRAYGPQGVGKALRLERELADLAGENAKISQENRKLRRQIDVLRSSPRAAERVARDELGLVRPEDMVFLFE